MLPGRAAVMNLRHLRYFVALAREGHYARAAEACHVTQPTLSEAIRQLEAELAVPLVQRDGNRRFGGLTPEGARVLPWAQRLLADQSALTQALDAFKGGLSGRLRFGVIPAASGVVPLVVAGFCRAHPNVTVAIVEMTSSDIQRGLDAGDLDAGMTYLENEPLRNVRTHTLYRERYLFLTPAGGAFDGRDTVGWDEVAAQPLCLLAPDMQNRRILDGLFRAAGVAAPVPRLETNAVPALIAQVCLGDWSTVVPHSFLSLFGAGGPAGARVIPLAPVPGDSQAVGVVVSDRDPMPALPAAFLAAVRAADVARAIDRALAPGASSALPMKPARNPI